MQTQGEQAPTQIIVQPVVNVQQSQSGYVYQRCPAFSKYLGPQYWPAWSFVVGVIGFFCILGGLQNLITDCNHSSDNDVSDNCDIFENGSNVTIYDPTEECTISNSRVYSSQRHSGIYCSSVTLNLINNEIYKNTQYGISVDNKTKTLIDKCNIYENKLCGVGLWKSVSEDEDELEDKERKNTKMDLDGSLTVKNSYICRNMDSGIYIAGNISIPIIVEQNEIIENSNCCIEIEKDLGEIYVRNNVVDQGSPFKVFIKNYSNDQPNFLPNNIRIENNFDINCRRSQNIQFKPWFVKNETITTKLSQEVLHAIERGICTASVTRKHFFVQEWYECITCGFANGEGVCVVCAMKCHLGHTLSEKKISSFYCDCGYGKRCTCFKEV